MKLLVRFIKFAFVLLLGVSISYLFISCTEQSVSEPGEVSLDIMPALPEVAVVTTDYDPELIQSAFINADVHSRFTKAYSSVYTASLKESMAGLVSIAINSLGGDGENFLLCLNSADKIKDKNYLPCKVESAKYEGKDAWIIQINWGAGQEGLGHTACCAIDKESQKMLFWISCK